MKAVTIQDIAQKAGVAKSSVSRVLNNRDSLVSKAMKEKIFTIARQLNYRPHYFAKSLKENKTGCIGFMGSNRMAPLSDIYFSTVAEGVEDALAQAGSDYSMVLFGANHHQTYAKSIELIKKGMVDGLILTVVARELPTFEQTLLPILQEINIPFVVIHSLSRELGYNNVGIDGVRGGYLAGQHLLSQGYRDIAYYRLEKGSPHEEEKLEGFKAALAEQGIVLDHRRIIESTYEHGKEVHQDAYRVFSQLPQLPRALFCPYDQASLGVLKALHERGIPVPERMSLVSFEDERPYPGQEPELTTVHHPVKEKAAVAVRILLEILDGTRKPDQVHRQILQPYLAVRKTG